MSTGLTRPPAAASGSRPDGAPGCPLCGSDASHALPRAHGRRYLRCTGCELVYMHPADRLDRAAEHAYYRLHRNALDDPRYRGWLDRLATPLVQRLRPGARGLDFGCGPAPALAAMLTERGWPTAVWDPLFAPDRTPLQRCHDFITCTEVIEHIHHPAEVLSALDALLAPGGWLAVMTRWWQPGTDLATWHYARDPTHVAFYSPPTLQWMARRHGWALHCPVPDVALWHKPVPVQPAY